ncbi:Sc15 protein [Favolaschia claudopus]|uniref:Sc15 protein n=1 Tax=Favolaschia claudopus TaxID=2862362 RepID=A0AAW0D2X6_9AGAR
MFALRLVSLFFLATTTFVSASPVAAPVLVPVADSTVQLEAFDKRASISSITGVLNTLEGKVGSILPQIDNLVATASATEANVAPLVLQLTTALNSASLSLTLLGLGLKRQTEADVANLVAGLVSDIATSLNGLEGLASSIPGLSGLTGTVDVALNSVLVNLNGLLAGILGTLAGLLGPVTGILSGLGLTGVLGSLGL